MVYFQIEPLTGWGKPKTPAPRPAVFRAPWEKTIDDLKHEVDLLNGKVIACQIGITDGAVRRDGMLRSTARVTGFQGVRVSFESKHGPLTYATDAFTFWKDNVRAITLGLTALRAVDRYGISRSGEQYTGWKAISAAPGAGLMTPEVARKVFESTVGPEAADADLSTATGIGRAFRSATKRHHPDRGGSDSVIGQIVQARDALLAAVR